MFTQDVGRGRQSLRERSHHRQALISMVRAWWRGWCRLSRPTASTIARNVIRAGIRNLQNRRFYAAPAK